jgi:Fic family protein
MEVIMPWPPLSYETLQWKSSVAGGMSLIRRAQLNGRYEAAVPPAIAGRTISLSSELVGIVVDATAELTRFDAEMGGVPAPLSSILLRSESASSSQIENLTSGARAIAEAEIGEQARGNAAEIVGNVHAMEAAVALADDLSSDTIIRMQRALLAHTHPELTGGYRWMQVWVGASASSPRGASFVPPTPGRVPGAMDDLVAFAREVHPLALAQIAVAHAQFETIHPFPDGNGRTGRALVQSMLRRSGITRSTTVPISGGLLLERDGYFDALGAYRSGDLEPIVRVFSEAAYVATDNGRILTRALLRARARWDEQMTGVRRDAAAHQVLDLALSQPALTAEIVANTLGVSLQTAYTALATLVDRDVLQHAKSQKRNQVWLAADVLVALDSFAERMARRG